MRKYFTLLFILLSVGTLSAQNLNFKDTNGLKNLLCSHTWYRYSINSDSSFSDRFMDSIKFYNNHTYYKSLQPKEDTIYKHYFPNSVITGKWHFLSTGKLLRSDSASDCMSIQLVYEQQKNMYNIYKFVLIDSHRISGSKRAKISGNLSTPFLTTQYSDASPDCNRQAIWQPRREFKKAKKH
ncbi:MAG TPA: hypothetical protein VK809_12750 [Bacteroidia bacterium]|nr:hypothetical protein [Bacteroidia bacterium]